MGLGGRAETPLVIHCIKCRTTEYCCGAAAAWPAVSKGAAVTPRSAAELRGVTYWRTGVPAWLCGTLPVIPGGWRR